MPMLPTKVTLTTAVYKNDILQSCGQTDIAHKSSGLAKHTIIKQSSKL